MAFDRFELGSSVEVHADFKTNKKTVPPSQYIDPATITLVIRRPDKSIETRTYGVSGISKLDIGKYMAIIVLAQEGSYHWRFTGSSGSNQTGVKSGQFESIRETNF